MIDPWLDNSSVKTRVSNKFGSPIFLVTEKYAHPKRAYSRPSRTSYMEMGDGRALKKWENCAPDIGWTWQSWHGIEKHIIVLLFSHVAVEINTFFTKEPHQEAEGFHLKTWYLFVLGIISIVYGKPFYTSILRFITFDFFKIPACIFLLSVKTEFTLAHCGR